MPLPEPHILVSGAKLSEIHPLPLMSHILKGISGLELVPSQFGPVPRGCTLSYQCPPLTPDLPVIDFPPLPLPGFSFSSNLAFFPNLHKALHLESLKVSPTTADEIEKGTKSNLNVKLGYKYVGQGLLQADSVRYDMCEGKHQGKHW